MVRNSNQVNPPRKKPEGIIKVSKDDMWRLILKDKCGASMVICRMPYVCCKTLSLLITNFLSNIGVKLNGNFVIVR